MSYTNSRTSKDGLPRGLSRDHVLSDVPVTFQQVFLLQSSHMAVQAASLPFSEGRNDGAGASSLHTTQSQGL